MMITVIGAQHFNQPGIGYADSPTGRDIMSNPTIAVSTVLEASSQLTIAQLRAALAALGLRIEFRITKR
jgi:hypothetical protein